MLDDSLGGIGTTLRLTLVLVLVATPPAWYVAVPVTVLAIVGLSVPGFASRSTLWLTVAGALAAGNLSQWSQVDNHQFLIVYWCLAVGLALTTAHAERAMALSARYLVGCVFALAVIWKVLAPDFLDGTFLHFTLLTDVRFADLASMVGGLNPADLEHNRATMTSLAVAGTPLRLARLSATEHTAALATVLTWWTIAIETAVAVAFLTPGRVVARARDGLLLAFIVTTYAAAPVVGFGWVLACLGLAQHDRDRRWVRTSYLAAFLLVQIYVVPWDNLIRAAFGAAIAA